MNNVITTLHAIYGTSVGLSKHTGPCEFEDL